MDIDSGSFTLWEEFYNASVRLLKMEKYIEAKRLARKSLNEAIDVYGPSHSASGMSLFLLGLISQYKAEYADIRYVKKQVIKMRDGYGISNEVKAFLRQLEDGKAEKEED